MFLELLTRTGTKQTLTSIKDLGAETLMYQVDHVGHVCSPCRSRYISLQSKRLPLHLWHFSEAEQLISESLCWRCM